MSISVNGQSVVPPGFRFHPTEEELLTYYLAKKVASCRIDLDVIPDVDLNKLEPWDIQERCRIGTGPQSDWYLFSHKDKKYPTGTRTNRATAAGFWKATGRDKPIYSSSSGSGTGKIGMRKTLVFYKGRAPHGTKSDWIMHEYRLHDDAQNHQSSPGAASSSPIRGGDQSAAQQEEGWVICRVFKKKNLICSSSSNNNNQALASHPQISSNNNKQPSPSRSCSAVSDDHHAASRAAAAQMLHHYSAGGSGDVDTDTLDHILRYMGSNNGKQESKPPPLTSACSLPNMDQYSLVNGGGGGTLYDKFMKLPPLEHVVVSGSGGGLLQLPPPTPQGSQYGGADCWADTLAAYELNGGLSDNDVDGSTKTTNGGMSTPGCFFVAEQNHQHGHGGGGDGDLWSLARSSVSTLHADLATAMNNV